MAAKTALSDDKCPHKDVNIHSDYRRIQSSTIDTAALQLAVL